MLLIATTNPNKIKEIVAILSDLPIALKTLRDFPAIEIPEETGATFQANARDKALYYAKATGCLTIAEDSGFEVDAWTASPAFIPRAICGPTRPTANDSARFMNGSAIAT